MIDLNYFYRTLDKTKQEYSETEGNDYPLFFACKNNDRDVRVGRRGNMETKVKRRLIHLLFAFLLAAGWYLIQYFCAYVVMSGSMEPTIPTGSIVVVDGRKKERKPGDIITYRRGSVVVTHRIVKKREEGYCTKGDSNEEDDAGIVSEGQIIGNVIMVLPWIGYGIVWLRQRRILFFLTVIAAMLFTVRRLWHDRIEIEEKHI